MFEDLASLGDIDLRLDQLRHQLKTLPELARLADIQSKIADCDKELAEIDLALAELDADESALEDQQAKIDVRIGHIQSESRTNTSLSYRDQEVMSAELASLLEQKQKLEDEELAFLESGETLQLQRDILTQKIESYKSALSQVQTELQEKDREFKAQISILEDQRKTVTGSIDPDLLAQYMSIYKRYNDCGVAHINGGRCSVCHLQLSASEIDASKNEPEEIHYCEHCGRILLQG